MPAAQVNADCQRWAQLVASAFQQALLWMALAAHCILLCGREPLLLNPCMRPWPRSSHLMTHGRPKDAENLHLLSRSSTVAAQALSAACGWLGALGRRCRHSRHPPHHLVDWALYVRVHKSLRSTPSRETESKQSQVHGQPPGASVTKHSSQFIGKAAPSRPNTRRPWQGYPLGSCMPLSHRRPP